MNILEPVLVKMGDTETELRENYVRKQIMFIKESLSDLMDNKYQKWQRLYEGKPKEEKKSFPWPGASNIVIQVTAQTVDTLVAQIIGSIYEIMPLWGLKLEGDWSPEDKGEEQREALEAFLNLMGLEPHELDLYRVENIGFSIAAKYGMCAFKAPWLHEVEANVTGVRDGNPIYTEEIRYSGPRPEAIPFDRFGISPQATTFESAEFKYHKITLKKFHLEERKFRGIYDKAEVDKILTMPDRCGPDPNTEAKQAAQGINEKGSEDSAQEWDLYECHYPYWYEIQGQKVKFRIIETYHLKSKTSLRAIYNPYPDNEEIFVSARLGYDDRGIYGMGFCEMLEHGQEEITSAHNRSADNDTLANTNVLRVDPDSKLDSTFSIYPMAILPFKAGDVEIMNLGRNTSGNIDRENQMFGIIKARTGVDHGISGSGSGITNPKRGIYSAMGTFAVMQAGNRRSNIRITDMRTAHIELGRKFLRQYANFGIGKRINQFGNMSKYIKQGLDSYKNGKIGLPVRAATASINKELEKQNDMMLVNIMRQHYQIIAQMLTNLQSMPPHVQEYITNVIIASDSLMRHILRNFGHDDVSRILPQSKFIKELTDGTAARQQPNGGGAGPDAQTVGGNGLPQDSLQSPGGNSNMVFGSGGGDVR